MIEIDRSNFQKEVLEERNKKVVLFFYNEEETSENAAQLLEKLEKEKNNLKFCSINAQEEKMLAFNFQAWTLPSVLFLQRGEVIGSVEGEISEKALENLFSVEEGL